MIIILRGSKVRSKLVESSLGHTMYDTYVSTRLFIRFGAFYHEISLVRSFKN